MTEDQKDQWKETGGFAEDTEIAQIVCKTEDIERWDKKAEEADLSRSRYLYKLINEAESYREYGMQVPSQDLGRAEELKEEIQRLEKKLERKESENSEAVSLDPETLKDALSDNYQELGEILHALVESGLMDDVLRKPVENQLYFMAAEDEVKFERGWGWKLVGGEA